MTIREAKQDDFAGILPLFYQLWPGKAIDEAALHTVYERGLKEDQYFLAEEGGRIAGFIAFAAVNCFWQEGRNGYVYTLVVDEALRSRGIGQALLDAACARAKAMGLKRLELDSGFPRERAHAFYEKNGFEKRAYFFSRDLAK